MAYLQTSDFKLGMDRTRERYTGTPGALWTLKNGHITRGGDVEGMKRFVPLYTLPPGTFSMWQVRGQLYVFGSNDLAASMPPGVLYQRLQTGNGANMLSVLDVRAFNGKLYVIATFDDGNIHHFFDGTRVSTLDTVFDGNCTRSTLTAAAADRINVRTDVLATGFGDTLSITALVPGTPFAVAATYTNGGTTPDQTVQVATQQANVPAVVEVRASGTFTITAGTPNPGVNRILTARAGTTDLISGPIDAEGSTAATAIRLAVEVNNLTSTHGYSAVASGNVVTVQAAPGTGATKNGTALLVAAAGNVAASTSGPLTGGVTAVAATAQITTVKLGGTFEALDTLTVTITPNGGSPVDYKLTGRASGAGTSAFVFKKKMWSPANSLYLYSDIDDPSNYGNNIVTGSGGGFVNMANQSEGTERLLASAEYNGNGAILARRSIRIWTLDADPTKNTFLQTLDNTGTLAPRSVVKYGNQDVFYLSDSGIRSVRARDSSGAPVADDVGTRIDTFIQGHFAMTTPAEQERACAVVEPIDGRYLLAMSGRVYVFSYFPALKISAWSYYEPTDTNGVSLKFTDLVRADRRVYARAGDTIYIYGGTDGKTYPGEGETPCVVETPFVSGGTPATIKDMLGFDIACVNTWQVNQLVDPNNEAAVVNVGKLFRTTYNDPSIKTVDQAGVFALQMTSSGAGRRVLSAVADHFAPREAA